MVILLVVFVVLFAATLPIGTVGKSDTVDDYCRMECWDVKINQINHCC